MNNSITEFFEWYVLQDNPIQGLHFDFQGRTIRLLLENYDDISHCFVEQTFIFKEVSLFTFSYPSDEFFLRCDPFIEPNWKKRLKMSTN